MTSAATRFVCDLAKDQRVLYVCSGLMVEEAVKEVGLSARPSTEGAEVVGLRRTNGDQEAFFAGGGSVRFVAWSKVLGFVRGRTFDHVVLDHRHYLESNEFLMALAPCFSQGERYTVLHGGLGE